MITEGPVWESERYGKHRAGCHIYECSGCSRSFYCDCDNGGFFTPVIPYYSKWWNDWVQRKIEGEN